MSALYLHLLGGGALAGWIALALVSRSPQGQLPVFLAVTGWSWVMFLGAWHALRRVRPAHHLKWLLLWAAAFRVAGLYAQPLLDDDYFRFLWDGRQFALTGNPYASTPAEHFADPDLSEPFREILDHVNYPHVPTIYGPLCETAFLISYLVAPGKLWPWKCLLLLAEALTMWCLLRLAPAQSVGGSPEGNSAPCAKAAVALVAGWCPLGVFETSFNAHPDMLGVALLCAAIYQAQRGRLVAMAVLCGLAVAGKILALLLAPFLLRRQWKCWAVFVGTVAVAYGDFWWQGSAAEVAGLRAMAETWEFNSSVYALTTIVSGPQSARIICGMLFAAVWLFIFHRQLSLRPGAGFQAARLPGVMVYGTFLLLSPTVNPWYLLWLLPFAALNPSLTSLSAMALMTLSYCTGLNLGDPLLGNFEHPAWVRPLEYGGIGLAIFGDLWRARKQATNRAAGPA